jgi:hypothetical protein
MDFIVSNDLSFELILDTYYTEARLPSIEEIIDERMADIWGTARVRHSIHEEVKVAFNHRMQRRRWRERLCRHIKSLWDSTDSDEYYVHYPRWNNLTKNISNGLHHPRPFHMVTEGARGYVYDPFFVTSVPGDVVSLNLIRRLATRLKFDEIGLVHPFDDLIIEKLARYSNTCGLASWLDRPTGEELIVHP